MRRSGAWVTRRWWYQEELELAGEREAMVVAGDWEGESEE